MKRRGKPKPPSKATQHLLESLQRKRETRSINKRFLIVCEDDKSAPTYFRAMKAYFRLPATSIEVVGGGGRSQPDQVVQRAVELKRLSSIDESGTLPFDHVWCTVDGDYGSKVGPARTTAAGHGVELIVSTKCFEYWILLHFEDSATPTACCADTVRTLRERHLDSYDKGKCNFSSIVTNCQIAAKRAKALRVVRQHDLPEDHNPCSEVYKIVDAIVAGMNAV